MDNRIKIRDAIQSGRIEEAIALVNQLHPELLDNDRHLYFHLQVLVIITAYLLEKPITQLLHGILSLFSNYN